MSVFACIVSFRVGETKHINKMIEIVAYFGYYFIDNFKYCLVLLMWCRCTIERRRKK